jgi:hypothetical protein
MTIQTRIQQFRIRHAAKTAFAAILCVIITHIFHISTRFAYIAPLAIAMEMIMYHQEIYVKSLERMIGTTISIGITLIISMLFIQNAVVFMGAISVFLFCILYLFGIKQYPYAAMFSCIFCSIMMISAVETPSQTYLIGRELIIQLGIGTIVIILVETFWPAHAGSSFRREFGYSLLAVGSILSIDKLKKIIPSVERPLTLKNIGDITILIRHAQKYSITQRAVAHQLIKHLKYLHFKITDLNISITKLSKSTAISYIESDLQNALQQLQQHIEPIAERILSAKFDTKKHIHSVDILTPLYEKLSQLREEQIIYDLPYTDSFELLALPHVLKGIMSEIRTIHLFFGKIKSIKKLRTIKYAAVELTPTFRLYFDINAIKIVLKVLMGILLILIMHFYFNWQGVEQALIATIIIIAQSNVGQTTLKAKNRFLGVIAGAIVGFVFLIIFIKITHFILLLGMMFLGLFVATYVALGSEKRSYIGAQAAIMLPIILLMSHTVADSALHYAFLRLWGVVQAIIVGLFIVYFIWPLHPMRLLRHYLAQLICNCTKIYKDFSAPASCQAHLSVHERSQLLNTMETNLLQNYETCKDTQYLLESRASHHQDYTNLVGSVELLYFELVEASKTIRKLNPDVAALFTAFVQPTHDKITALLDAIVIGVNKREVAPLLFQQLNSLKEEIEQDFQAFRESKVTAHVPIEEISQLTHFGSRLINISMLIEKILATFDTMVAPKRSEKPQDVLQNN